jgi:hypothetical protein
MNPMYVIFIHGPAAVGKYTIGVRLSELTGLPLFHNHLAVDAAKALFEFGSAAFKKMRAAIWLTAFNEAAAVGRSFIFTFHPEASVEPSLLNHLIKVVEAVDGQVFFVSLVCSPKTILDRLPAPDRLKFGKLTDPVLYTAIECSGGFEFPAMPPPILTIDTGNTPASDSAQRIAQVIAPGIV